MTATMNRRGFLKSAGALGLSMVVGFSASGLLAASENASTDASAEFNHFVKIDDDGTVTVIVKHFEMGQGTSTGLTTLVAEEMDLAWDTVKFEFAPSHENYINLAFGGQGTGGSTAMANSFMQYRQAGAAARDMLVRAAAKAWGVDAAAVTIKDGILSTGDRTASIGEFVQQAAKLTPAKEPALKETANFKLIGKDKLPRKDSAAKTNGKATFAMDVKVPNMVYVTILRSPKFGGTLKRFEVGDAKTVNGFVDAKALPNMAGVAVYAESTWAAIKARKAIKAEWDDSAADSRGTPEMLKDYAAKLDAKPTYDVTKKDDLVKVEEAAKAATKTVSADFFFPLLAHAPMEPLNCVIEPTENGGLKLHDGCQFPQYLCR